MTDYVDIYKEIDKEKLEVITIEQLEAYQTENDLNPDMVKKWKNLFDKEETGEIKYQDFCEQLKITYIPLNKQIDEEPIAPTKVPPVNKAAPAPVPAFPLVYQSDMDSDMRLQVLNKLDLYYKEAKGKDCDYLKLIDELDECYGKKWHCGPIKSEENIPVCPFIQGTLLCCSPDGKGKHKLLIWQQQRSESDDSFCFCS